MKKRAAVYNNGVLAGFLEKTEKGDYLFTYDSSYFDNPEAPPISISFPKKQQTYRSAVLFPFFFGLLSEGVNKQTQCRRLKIDEKDHFTLLLKTAGSDTIGAVTIKEI